MQLYKWIIGYNFHKSLADGELLWCWSILYFLATGGDYSNDELYCCDKATRGTFNEKRLNSSNLSKSCGLAAMRLLMRATGDLILDEFSSGGFWRNSSNRSQRRSSELNKLDTDGLLCGCFSGDDGKAYWYNLLSETPSNGGSCCCSFSLPFFANLNRVTETNKITV